MSDFIEDDPHNNHMHTSHHQGAADGYLDSLAAAAPVGTRMGDDFPASGLSPECGRGGSVSHFESGYSSAPETFPQHGAGLPLPAPMGAPQARPIPTAGGADAPFSAPPGHVLDAMIEDGLSSARIHLCVAREEIERAESAYRQAFGEHGWEVPEDDLEACQMTLAAEMVAGLLERCPKEDEEAGHDE